jgi:hypothetical protein
MNTLHILKSTWISFRLIIYADSAFSLAAKEKDEDALNKIKEVSEKYGDLTQYKFGIELVLLEIFIKECHYGVSPEEYDWNGLNNIIAQSSEYNDAEKLHLLLYLEELANVVGVHLLDDKTVYFPKKGEMVASRIVRRFPKLSEC